MMSKCPRIPYWLNCRCCLVLLLLLGRIPTLERGTQRRHLRTLLLLNQKQYPKTRPRSFLLVYTLHDFFHASLNMIPLHHLSSHTGNARTTPWLPPSLAPIPPGVSGNIIPPSFARCTFWPHRFSLFWNPKKSIP